MANTTSPTPYPTLSWHVSKQWGSDGVCNTVSYFISGKDFAILAPRGAICPYGESHADAWVDEFQYMIEITMFLGLLVLAGVLARACSRVKVDWYRLIFLYVIGTIFVPISIALGPSYQYGGFNRINGFGIMIHNMSEWFIISGIWYGLEPTNKYKLYDPCQTLSKLCCKCCHSKNDIYSVGPRFIVVYIWLMLTALTLMPMSPLFLIAMIQGAFCDWFLVLTFAHTAYQMQRHKGQYWWYGFAAALMHISTIQPLFVGFALSYKVLNAITVLFLIPTFIIYLWFASADAQTVVNVVSPNATGVFVMDQVRNEILEKILNKENQLAVAVEMGDIKSRPNAASNSENNNGDSGVSSESNNNNDNKENKDNNEAALMNEDDKEKSFLKRILQDGLLSQERGRNKFWGLAIGAFCLSTANSLFAYFLPCMVSTESLRNLIC